MRPKIIGFVCVTAVHRKQHNLAKDQMARGKSKEIFSAGLITNILAVPMTWLITCAICTVHKWKSFGLAEWQITG
jgi:hypothetical protein